MFVTAAFCVDAETWLKNSGLEYQTPGTIHFVIYEDRSVCTSNEAQERGDCFFFRSVMSVYKVSEINDIVPVFHWNQFNSTVRPFLCTLYHPTTSDERLNSRKKTTDGL